MDNLKLAAKVHYSFMPRAYNDHDFDVDVHLTPLHNIGGDYCSIKLHQDNRLLLCICDVVGHGITSALLAARINTLVMTVRDDISDPCSLLDLINTFLCDHLGDSGIYASMFCLMIDRDAMTFSYAGAAHPPALHYSARNKLVTSLESASTLVGIETPLPVACVVNHRSIEPGDRVMLYTDGLIETRNPQGREFGQDQLESLLIRYSYLDNRTFNEMLMERQHDFCQGFQSDDTLIMTLDRPAAT